MPLFVPALWLFALAWGDVWAAVPGFAWAIARFGFIVAYGRAAEKREPYFLAQMFVAFVLWCGALIGVVRGLL